MSGTDQSDVNAPAQLPASGFQAWRGAGNVLSGTFTVSSVDRVSVGHRVKVLTATTGVLTKKLVEMQ